MIPPRLMSKPTTNLMGCFFIEWANTSDRLSDMAVSFCPAIGQLAKAIVSKEISTALWRETEESARNPAFCMNDKLFEACAAPNLPRRSD